MGMKRLCNYCKTKMAVWVYMPKDDRWYCDDCISRGCSCNIDPDTHEEDRDEQGRLLPCCEYEYDAEGFDVD